MDPGGHDDVTTAPARPVDPGPSNAATRSDPSTPTTPPPPEAPTQLPTWLARTWVVAGTVGVVVSLVGAIVGVAFVRSLTATSLEAIELSSAVLGTVDETATVLDQTFADVATTLDTVSDTVGETTATLDEVGTTLDDLTVLVTEDVPDSLDAVSDAMPQLISTAGVIDSTMRALSFVGVDYDPDTPLDGSLRELDARLAEVAPDLRDQREGLDSVGTRLETLAGQGATLSHDVADVNADLDAARDLVDDFAVVADEAGALTADLSDRLAWQSGIAQVALVVLALAVAITQTVPIVLGLRALGWDGRRRDDRAGAEATDATTGHDATEHGEPIT